MDVFIHEEYVNKRNEVRREQRRRQQLRMLQVGGKADASWPAPAPRESPGAAAPCVAPSVASPSSIIFSPTASVSPASADGETAAWSPEHPLFDGLKPY
jgi:hypothetical protein